MTKASTTTASFLFGWFCSLAACGSGGADSNDRPPKDSDWPPLPKEAVSLSFEPLGQTFQNEKPASPTNLVLETEAEWGGFWAEYAAAFIPKPPQPEIDFSTHLVVVAALGLTHGSGVRIYKVFETDARILVWVLAEHLPAECPAPTALGAPTAIVRIERSGKAVEFQRVDRTRVCGDR